MREAAEDTISNLPDSLIHSILAFLHISDCARASVLSRRWNYIWTTVPTLYLQKRNPRSLQLPSPSETEKFMDFVDGTFLRRSNSSNVDEFTLIWDCHLSDTRVRSWISNVIRGEAKVLRLYLNQEQLSCIPLSLFTCESLTSLELGGCFHTFTFPKRVSFPRLKRLKLREFRFNDECWNEDLFSNFHVLEELILEYCQFHLRNFCISIPTLKLLKIHMWEPRDGSLDSANNVAKENVLPSFPTLVEAVVLFYSKIDVAGINQLLRALAHVKCLTVNDRTLKAFRAAYDPSNKKLTFHNVKMLSMSDNLTTDQGLIALLNAVPNLESLIFSEISTIGTDTDDDEYSDEENSNGKASDEDGSDEDGREEEDSDADGREEEDMDDDDNEDDSAAVDIVTNGCLFPHLTSVSFKKFFGGPMGLRWLKLILKTAKALQMITLGCKGKSERIEGRDTMFSQSLTRLCDKVLFLLATVTNLS